MRMQAQGKRRARANGGNVAARVRSKSVNTPSMLTVLFFYSVLLTFWIVAT